MCGLVGIAGDLEFKDEATMKRLFIFDFFRGPDSTGFANLRTNGDVKLVKMASHPIDLFDSKRFQDALSGYNSSVFLGHNRFATKGKVNGSNAHPYQYGHIIGAHNGTLDAASWKRLNTALGYDTDVDSQAIFACFEAIGVEETIKLMQEGSTSQEGAWALTWFNTEDKTLNFLRNKHRPLWYAYSDDYKRIFWASEWKMIDAALDMTTASVPYKYATDKDGYRYWQFEENMWYKYDINELRKGSKDRFKPVGKLCKGREPAPVYKAAGAAPFHQHGQHHHGSSQTPTMGTPPTGTMTSTSTYGGTGTASNIIKLPELLELESTPTLPYGIAMGRDRFEQIAQYGCSWCKDDVPFGANGAYVYEMVDKVLCPTCSGGNGASRIYTSYPEMKTLHQLLMDNKESKIIADLDSKVA